MVAHTNGKALKRHPLALSLLAFLGMSFGAGNAFAVDCDTDCDEHCERCPFGLGCYVDPVCRGTCLAEKESLGCGGVVCSVLNVNPYMLQAQLALNVARDRGWVTSEQQCRDEDTGNWVGNEIISYYHDAANAVPGGSLFWDAFERCLCASIDWSAGSQTHGDILYIYSSCPHSMQVALRSSFDGQWTTWAWYSIPAGPLASNFGPLSATNDRRTVYYYAETTDGSNLVWSGDNAVTVGDRTLYFKEWDTGSEYGHQVLHLTCP